MLCDTFTLLISVLHSLVRSTGKWTVFVRDERHDGILRTSSISSVVCTFFSRRVLFGREWRKQLKMHIMMWRTGCVTGCPLTFGAIYCTVIARHGTSTALTHTSQLIISQKSFSCKQQQLVVYDQYCKCDCLTASAEVCKPVRLKIPLAILVTVLYCVGATCIPYVVYTGSTHEKERVCTGKCTHSPTLTTHHAYCTSTNRYPNSLQVSYRFYVWYEKKNQILPNLAIRTVLKFNRKWSE